MLPGVLCCLLYGAAFAHAAVLVFCLPLATPLANLLCWYHKVTTILVQLSWMCCDKYLVVYMWSGVLMSIAKLSPIAAPVCSGYEGVNRDSIVTSCSQLNHYNFEQYNTERRSTCWDCAAFFCVIGLVWADSCNITTCIHIYTVPNLPANSWHIF